MVQKYISLICQKLAIAAALAALCCLPAAAQSSQMIEILTVNGKPMLFTEFLKTYPDETARDKILAALDEKTEDAFRKWELKQLNKITAEMDVALKLITEMNIVLDELTKEQAASKPVMPEQQAINKNRATILNAALSNPTVASRLSSQALSILRMTSDNLQKGGNLTQLNIDLVKNVKILPNK